MNMNAVIDRSTYIESHQATLEFLVEKPPVDSVLIAWHIASKKFIGPAHSITHNIPVRAIYTIHRLLAVELMRGRSLSWVMPVTSALNSCMPPAWLSIGSTASEKSIIPIPPTQCITARQKSMARGNTSTSAITVRPVVVNPDMVSMKAAATLSMEWVKKNGSIPNAE